MLDKKIDDVKFADIAVLVTNKVRENHYLEYKGAVNNSDHGKAEVLKDVSSFANANGGYIIFGVTEEDGEPKEALGIDKNVGNQKVDEWLTNIVVSGTDEKVSFQTKILSVPKSEKVLLVVHIPESIAKPHMVTSQGKYTFFLRHNNATQNASKSEIKSMFKYTEQLSEGLEKFLEKRHLLDEDSKVFGQNHYSKKLLYKNYQNDKEVKSYILISVAPVIVKENRLDTISGDFVGWVEANIKGYNPASSVGIIYGTYNREIDLHGVAYPYKFGKKEDNEPDYYRNYLNVLNSGYLELGASNIFYSAQNGTVVLNLGLVTGLSWLMMGFASKFYQHIGYDNELYIQVSFVNMKDKILGGFGLKDPKNKSTWAEPYSFYYGHDEPPHPINDNFKIAMRVKASELTDEDFVEKLAKEFSTKTARAFGLAESRSFDDEGNYNGTSNLLHFNR